MSPDQVTHSICAGCVRKVDSQIAAQAEAATLVNDTYACPSCPRDAVPYRVISDGEQRRMLYVRCRGCGLSWVVEA